MTIFRYLYKRKLLRLLRSLPNERREEVVTEILANASDWDIFRSALPHAFFPLFHSRQELQEIDRRFADLVRRNDYHP